MSRVVELGGPLHYDGDVMTADWPGRPRGWFIKVDAGPMDMAGMSGQIVVIQPFNGIERLRNRHVRLTGTFSIQGKPTREWYELSNITRAG